MDNTELLQRIEKLEKQVELLQAEITAIKNIEVSEKTREKIDKMERANKLVSLMENLSGEKRYLMLKKTKSLKSFIMYLNKQN